MHKKFEDGDHALHSKRQSSDKHSTHKKKQDHDAVIINKNKHSAGGDYHNESTSKLLTYEQSTDIHKSKRYRNRKHKDVQATLIENENRKIRKHRHAENTSLENEVASNAKYKSKTEKFEKEKYNKKKYLEDTNETSNKLGDNRSSLSLGSCSIILNSQQNNHKKDNANIPDHSRKSFSNLQGIKPKEKKRKKRKRSNEKKSKERQSDNTQVLFTQIKTMSPFRPQSHDRRDCEIHSNTTKKHTSKDRDHYSKTSDKETRGDYKYSSEAKHNLKVEDQTGVEKMKIKKRHKHHKKNEDPLYLGVYDKYFVFEKKSESVVDEKKRRSRPSSPTQNEPFNNTTGNNKKKDKREHDKRKFQENVQENKTEELSPKLEDDLKSYFTKIQNLIDKKLNALLYSKKSMEQFNDYEIENKSKKKVKRRPRRERDERCSKPHRHSRKEKRVIENVVSDSNNYNISRKRKETESPGKFNIMHSLLADEYKKVSDIPSSKNSETVQSNVGVINTNYSTKIPTRKQRSPNFDNADELTPKSTQSSGSPTRKYEMLHDIKRKIQSAKGQNNRRIHSYKNVDDILSRVKSTKSPTRKKAMKNENDEPICSSVHKPSSNYDSLENTEYVRSNKNVIAKQKVSSCKSKRKSEGSKLSINTDDLSDFIEKSCELQIERYYKPSRNKTKSQHHNGSLNTQSDSLDNNKYLKYNEHPIVSKHHIHSSENETKKMEKRSSLISEDQNQIIRKESPKRFKKAHSRKKICHDNEQTNDRDARSAEKQNGIQKVIEIIEEPPKRRIYHLECKTVSVVGIPSQIKDESTLLNNIQTSTSLKMLNSSDEPVEKKKKTKRFKVYYKYSVADNVYNNFESGHSSGEKSIISDSYRIISDNSGDNSESSFQGKEPERHEIVVRNVRNRPTIEINNIPFKRRNKISTSKDFRLNNIDEEHSSENKPIDCKYFNTNVLQSSNSDYSVKTIKSPRHLLKLGTIKHKKTDNFDTNETSSIHIYQPAGKLGKLIKWRKSVNSFVSKSDIEISYSSLNNLKYIKTLKPKTTILTSNNTFLSVDKPHQKNVAQIQATDFDITEKLRKRYPDEFETYLLECLATQHEKGLKKVNYKTDKGLGTEPERRSIVNLKLPNEISNLYSKQNEKSKLHIQTSQIKMVDVGIEVNLIKDVDIQLEPTNICNNIHKAANASIGVNISNDFFQDKKVLKEIMKPPGKRLDNNTVEELIKPITTKKDCNCNTEVEMKLLPDKKTCNCATETILNLPTDAPKIQQISFLPRYVGNTPVRGILKKNFTNIDHNLKEQCTQMSNSAVSKNFDINNIRKCIAMNTSLLDLRSSERFDDHNFDTLKLSKSEDNLRSLSMNRSESKVGSLVYLHRCDPTKMSSSVKSNCHSLDRYFVRSIINDNPHKSTLFLTKTYRTSDMSSYQRRKIYDDNIRRKMKRRLQLQNSAFRHGHFKPQVFEVRFMTVDHLSSRSNSIAVDETPTDNSNPYRDYDNLSEKNHTIPKIKYLRKPVTIKKVPCPRQCLIGPMPDVDSINKRNVLPHVTVTEILKENDDSLKENEKFQNGKFSKTSTSVDSTNAINASNIPSSDKTDNTNTDIEINLKSSIHHSLNINQLTDIICKSITAYFESSGLKLNNQVLEKNTVQALFHAYNFQNSNTSENIGLIIDNSNSKNTNIHFQKPISCPVFHPPNTSIGLPYQGSSTNLVGQSTILGYTFDSLTTNQDTVKCDLANSEESGYSSHKSRACESVKEFFKRPGIAALLKPHSDSETSEDTRPWNKQDKVLRKCQKYTKKIKKQEPIINNICHDLPLHNFSGRKHYSDSNNFNSNSSLYKGMSSLQEEDISDSETITSVAETRMSVDEIEDADNYTHADSKENIRKTIEPTNDVVECTVVFSNTNLNTSCITLLDTTLFDINNVESTNEKQNSKVDSTQKLKTDSGSIQLGVFSCENPIKFGNIMAKKFFENLLILYDKEVSVTNKLYKDNNFFENDLLAFIQSGNTLNTTSTIKKSKGVKKFIGKVFGVKHANKKLLEDKIFEVCKPVGEQFNEQQQQTLKYMAQNARRYFSMFVQAVKVNQEINDEIKICGLQKLLERIENGQFTFLKSSTQVNFEEEIKNQVKESFRTIYKLASEEAKRMHKALSVDDLKLIVAFICKYRIGMISKSDLIASFIGKGILKTENDLKVAVTYLMRQQTGDIDIKEFEEFCKLYSQTCK